MIYDSLKLFLDKFCEPASCSKANGMEFSVNTQLVDCLAKNHHVWLWITPDYATLRIKCIFIENQDHIEQDIEAESEIPITQATFEIVIDTIEELAKDTKECARQ